MAGRREDSPTETLQMYVVQSTGRTRCTAYSQHTRKLASLRTASLVSVLSACLCCPTLHANTCKTPSFWLDSPSVLLTFLLTGWTVPTVFRKHLDCIEQTYSASLCAAVEASNTIEGRRLDNLLDGRRKQQSHNDEGAPHTTYVHCMYGKKSECCAWKILKKKERFRGQQRGQPCVARF